MASLALVKVERLRLANQDSAWRGKRACQSPTGLSDAVIIIIIVMIIVTLIVCLPACLSVCRRRHHHHGCDGQTGPARHRIGQGTCVVPRHGRFGRPSRRS